MFEYLMPLLFMRSFEGSLLDRACHDAVRTQIEHARREDLPWFAAFGVFGMGGVQWLYYEAIQRIPIAVALVVEFTAVILVLLVARLQGRTVGRALWYAGVLSVGGCFFASGAYDAALRATGLRVLVVFRAVIMAFEGRR